MPKTQRPPAKRRTKRKSVFNQLGAIGLLQPVKLRNPQALLFIGIVAVVGSLAVAFTLATSKTSSLWNDATTPKVIADSDTQPVELGVKFKSAESGYITGVKFYKARANTGTHKGSLWTANGTLLATATFTNETANKWQTVIFSRPVPITAGTVYVASYHTNKGRYSADTGYFAKARVNGPLSALAGANGVYRYGSTSAFPTDTYKSTNYWVDVVFSPAVSSSPAPTPPPTPVVSATPVSTPTATPAPSASTTCPLPKYPTAACTGVPAGVVLAAYTGSLVITTPGQVIDGKRITGTLDIRANDVVIKNSEITGAIVNDNISSHPRFTIQDSVIRGSSNGGCSSWGNGAIGTYNYTAKRVRVSGFPDGFRVAGSNILIEDSHVTLCSANPVDHSDGIQAYGAAGASNIVIRHNTIDQRAVTNGAATAPIFIPTDGDRQGNNGINVTAINDNLLAGGGYSLRVYGTAFTAQSVTGNKIVNGTWSYGPVDVTCGSIGAWANNATVNFDWTTGQITGQVKSLTDCN